MLDKREIILYIRITEREEKRKQEPTEKRKAEKASQMFFSEIRICSFFYLALGFFSAVPFPRGKVEPKEKSRKGKDKEEKKRRKRAGKLHKGIWQKGNRFQGNAFEGSEKESGKRTFERMVFGRREALKESFSGSGKRKILQRISHFSN